MPWKANLVVIKYIYIYIHISWTVINPQVPSLHKFDMQHSTKEDTKNTESRVVSPPLLVVYVAGAARRACLPRCAGAAVQPWTSRDLKRYQHINPGESARILVLIEMHWKPSGNLHYRLSCTEIASAINIDQWSSKSDGAKCHTLQHLATKLQHF